MNMYSVQDKFNWGTANERKIKRWWNFNLLVRRDTNSNGSQTWNIAYGGQDLSFFIHGTRLRWVLKNHYFTLTNVYIQDYAYIYAHTDPINDKYTVKYIEASEDYSLILMSWVMLENPRNRMKASSFLSLDSLCIHIYAFVYIFCCFFFLYFFLSQFQYMYVFVGREEKWGRGVHI